MRKLLFTVLALILLLAAGARPLGAGSPATAEPVPESVRPLPIPPHSGGSFLVLQADASDAAWSADH